MRNHARFSVCLGGTSLGCDVFRGGEKEPGARIQEPGGLGRRRVGEWAKPVPGLRELSASSVVGAICKLGCGHVEHFGHVTAYPRAAFRAVTESAAFPLTS
jgi:hypothetical protein